MIIIGVVILRCMAKNTDMYIALGNYTILRQPTVNSAHHTSTGSLLLTVHAHAYRGRFLHNTWRISNLQVSLPSVLHFSSE